MTKSEFDDYLNWLCDIVVDEDHQGYDKLLSYLFERIFTWSVDGDANRAADGVHLRSVYEDQIGIPWKILDGFPCNILEMMVSLSVRASEDILWDGENNWTPYVFWTMIDNLGLTNQTNDVFDLSYVDDRIRIFLDRNYSENGVGGLFLRSHFYSQIPKKWEKLEIWYQMQEWISENFV